MSELATADTVRTNLEHSSHSDSNICALGDTGFECLVTMLVITAKAGECSQNLE